MEPGMKRRSGSEILVTAYLWLFMLYLFLPLIIMGAATFNTSRFPTITPWLGTTLKWFVALYHDGRMWEGLINSIVVGLVVVAISVPLGIGAAMLLTGLQGKARTFIYGVMVSPLLTPGIIIGISTLIFWTRLGVAPGLHLAVLGQCSFISAYVMLMVLARLQRLDGALEEAALDLGATHQQVFRRILLPYLKPSIVAASVLAFFQSFENYNTTLFTRGTDITLTIYIASKVRTGLTPAVNALALILITLTVIGAAIYEVLRRREAARDAAAQRRAQQVQPMRELELGVSVPGAD
jgi:spermidine/putrescine transport system permease protein